VTPVLVLCAVLGAAPAPDAPAPTPLPIRRFALVAGVNDGGPERVPLRYARSDAERVAHVLERLGGVAASDDVLLLDPDGPALRAAFRDVEARIRAARATHRAELVLYYSGHSDEQGLLLRGTRVSYQEVRRWLETVGAQVRIAIVDSCSSGALTREKGGRRAPPFLVDTSSAVRGHAILTSSAADEASQESDRIAASFFTHFLVTGLRGAADTSQDGKVTVGEAYQFAFSETLARTERTRSGAQHPAYDIQLVGSGDVVLTDLRGTDATLVFPEAASGRFFVRDGDGRLVAELRKLAGRPVELGVEPGTYRVVRDDGERLAEAQLAVASGARTPVPVGRLTAVGREPTARRGGELALVAVDVSVFPPLSLNGERATLNRLQIGLFGARTTRLRGFGLAPVLWAEEDVAGVQLGGLGASAGGSVEGTQVSGVGGVAGSVRGAQVSGVGALAHGHVEGAQLSGVGGVAGSLLGTQVAGIGALAQGRLEGAQVSGIGGMAGSLAGVQLSGMLNMVRGDMVGLQIGGFASWAGGHALGGQISGVANVAAGFEGAQLGVVNVAAELRGLQAGVVNVSTGTVRGSQIGIVNVSRQVDGIPFGLVNVVRDGWRRILLVSDEDGTPALGYAGGNALFHTTLEASLRRTAAGARGWAAAGPGVHLRFDRLGVDLDLLASHALDDEEPYAVVTLRALAALPIGPRVALVAGPTANVLLARDAGSAPAVRGAFGEATRPDGTRAWVGLQAGVRL
jgi:hypothetical protein